LIIATLAQQLESVQAAIAAIEGGAQSASSEGESLTRASLDTLYKREERLLNKIARADRGDVTVAEF
jgi:hypothetical protein